jgi:hypothetical protein
MKQSVKRILTVIIVTVMTIVSCTACGSGNSVKRGANSGHLAASSGSLQGSGISSGTKKVDANEMGNTNGNLDNNGLAAIQDDWIYYSTNKSVCKIKTDGTQRTVLCSGKADPNRYAAFINVLGDWVYYAAVNAPNTSIGVYKIKTDGTKRQQILSESTIDDLHVIGDWIYYNDEYKIKTDGTGKQKIYEQKVASGCTFNIVDGWFYFYDKDNNDNDCVFKMKTDGTDKKKIYSGHTDNMIVKDNLIYYVDYSDKCLYKMKTDGTDAKQLSTDRVYLSINISGNWIYYYSDNEGLCKIKTDGTGKQIIYSNCYPADINIVGDWIYYEDNSSQKLYRIKTAGTKQQLVG